MSPYLNMFALGLFAWLWYCQELRALESDPSRIPSRDLREATW